MQEATQEETTGGLQKVRAAPGLQQTKEQGPQCFGFIELNSVNSHINLKKGFQAPENNVPLLIT